MRCLEEDRQQLLRERAALQAERLSFEQMQSRVEEVNAMKKHKVRLNIGGSYFEPGPGTCLVPMPVPRGTVRFDCQLGCGFPADLQRCQQPATRLPRTIHASSQPVCRWRGRASRQAPRPPRSTQRWGRSRHHDP